METVSLEIYLISGITIFALFVSCFILFIILIYQKKQQYHKLEKARLKQQFQEELLRSQMEIHEQTLKNISQEIHDNIGQTLSLAKLNLNTISNEQNNVSPKIASTKELISKAIQDLRNISKALNTDAILGIGLINAIEHELEQLEKIGSLSATLQINGSIRNLNPQNELIVFRIVQESLNNIIKHSEAKRICIVATFKEDHLFLSIIDDGKGFQVSEKTANGTGLYNMRNRAKLIGGSLEIISNQLTGTQIDIIVPTH